jgi:peroxiredoxin
MLGAQALQVGTAAPEIDLPSLSGARVQLSSLRGRPVIVTFWGTWCPPCRTEFPELVRVFRDNAGAGLRILAVNGRDQETSTKAVQKFVDRYAVPFDVVLDERGTLRQSLKLVGLPTTVFVDTAGVVRRVNVGPTSAEELQSGLALILPQR